MNHPFQPLERGVHNIPADLEAWAQQLNVPLDQLKEHVAFLAEDEVWLNDTYQVNVRRMKAADEGAPDMVHLSIKRRDKAPVTDWRDKQAIKNQLVGPECEGVELYPAESRMVDTANQYHLWCIADPTFRFPFGWQKRFVRNESGGGAVQRPRG